MRSFYIDDSRRERSGISILGGFIINDSAYSSLQNSYRDIKARYALTPEDPAKWSPPRTAEFNKQRAIQDQNAFRSEVIGLLAASPIKIIAAVIEEHGRYNRQRKDYYLCASLEFLAQRFERELSQTSPDGRMVLDYPGEYHGSSMLKRYRRIRINGSNYPTFSMKLPSLDDTAYYSYDVTCDGIQLADFIVGAIGHSIDNRRYDHIRTLRPRVRKVQGKVKGVGIVVYPSNSAVVDSLIRVCESTS
jgi:hypothetical protein